MNKYPQTPEDTIDLHQMTRVEARARLLDFLAQSKQASHTLVRVIVGRGIHSKAGPVLGSYVRNLLDEQELDFRDAKVGEGAEGAIDVRI